MSDASGKPLPPNSAPAAGDRFSFASNDYAGNHKHHAKRATASDHVVCTVTSTSTPIGLCDGTIAIGGSMIFADDFVVNFNSNNVFKIKITGGTGRYRHAHGTVIVKSVGNNTDLTIKVSF
jgi:TPP-dependent indolepyruvate ferredoxin oxidoreductase alpha subunit